MGTLPPRPPGACAQASLSFPSLGAGWRMKGKGGRRLQGGWGTSRESLGAGWGMKGKGGRRLQGGWGDKRGKPRRRLGNEREGWAQARRRLGNERFRLETDKFRDTCRTIQCKDLGVVHASFRSSLFHAKVLLEPGAPSLRGPLLGRERVKRGNSPGPATSLLVG